jgi:hypothetical protein
MEGLPELKKAETPKTEAKAPKAETPKTPKAKAGHVLMVHKTRKNGDNKLYRQCLPSNVKAFEAAGFVVAD